MRRFARLLPVLLSAFILTAAPLPVARGDGGPSVGVSLPERTLVALRTGDRFVRDGDWQQAVVYYARAVEASPDALLPRLLIGVALTSVRRLDVAVTQLRIAQQIAEGDLVTMLLLQGALAEHGDSAEAQEIYLQTVRRFSRPGRPGLDASGSLTFLKGAASKLPESAVVQQLLGDSYQLAEQWPAADLAYRKALALAPGWSKPRVNLGLSQLAQNRPERAIETFQAALRQDPGNVQARLAMGEAQLKTGRNDEAIGTYKRLQGVPEAAGSAVTGLAQANVNLRRFDTALRYLDTAQNLSPKDPAPAATRAEVLLSTGDFTGAAASYEAALKLTQEGGLFTARPSLLRALAEAQLSARRPAEALETLRRALREEPERSALWHRLSAHAFEDLGDRVEMETALRRALDAETILYPQDTLNAIAARGLIEKTVAAYRTALEAARVGVGGQRQGDTIVVFSAQVSAEAQAVALSGLAHLMRYRGDAREEAAFRRDLCALRGTGIDWYLLAEAQERMDERKDAAASYRQALARGGLPAPAWNNAQKRLRALARD